ncbi:MAG: endonuclease [Muribaculaceae bacterium]|nr:endonuclease [Muribaculaceae bacterium]
MKKSLLSAIIVVMALACVPMSRADIPMSYYASLDGKKGAELKTAIHKLVTTGVKMLSYGSGTDKTWWGFYVTDYKIVNSKRQVIDRYSNDVRYYGNRGSSVSGMNIEHSFPKSWWGGTTNNAYKDLFNLMPSEQKINSSKSNYGMGIVTNVTTDNGCTKVGTGAGGNKYWEPADKWKGDFARDYMYMATAYQDFTWTGEGLKSLTTGAYPTLQQWAYTLYLQWARKDQVDQLEIDRNDAVYGIQGNRNPYVDFPNLMEYVWGDSINTPLNITTTLKAGDTSVGPGPNPDTPKVIYNETFLGSNGGCTASGTPGVWKVDTKYGWMGSAFFNGVCTEADASIETPELDLAGYKNAELTFEHAANKFGDDAPKNYCSVEVRVDGGNPQTLDVSTWPAGSNWTFLSSGVVDLTPYCGHKVNIVFHYTSTTSVAGTWEIKNCKVTASGTLGVNDLLPDNDIEDADAPVEYYSIDGRRLNPDNLQGLVIKRQGRRVTKEIIR